MYRLLLLGLAAVIVKLAMPVFGVELTWLQATIAVVLAQVFAFMHVGTQGLDIAILPSKEDDGE